MTYKNSSNFFGYVILKDILCLKFWYGVVFCFVNFKILCSFQKIYNIRLSCVIFLARNSKALNKIWDILNSLKNKFWSFTNFENKKFWKFTKRIEHFFFFKLTLSAFRLTFRFRGHCKLPHLTILKNKEEDLHRSKKTPPKPIPTLPSPHSTFPFHHPPPSNIHPWPKLYSWT